jgi:hypothetical protein
MQFGGVTEYSKTEDWSCSSWMIAFARSSARSDEEVKFPTEMGMETDELVEDTVIDAGATW